MIQYSNQATSSSLSSFYKTNIQFSRSMTPHSQFQLVEIGKKINFPPMLSMHGSTFKSLAIPIQISVISGCRTIFLFFQNQNIYVFISEMFIIINYNCKLLILARLAKKSERKEIQIYNSLLLCKT
jgi:hypothetical protein